MYVFYLTFKAMFNIDTITLIYQITRDKSDYYKTVRDVTGIRNSEVRKYEVKIE